MATVVPNLLADSLARDCYWPNAWAPDHYPEAEFSVYRARQDCGSFFQDCGRFDLNNLRWRITRSGIEINDVVVCEDFQTEEEWENEHHLEVPYVHRSEAERHETYLYELWKCVWPASFVRFHLNISFDCLIEILLRRAEIGLETRRYVDDNQNAQQWTDIFAVLIMIMARLPKKYTNSYANGLHMDIKWLATCRGQRKWPINKRGVGVFSRPLTKGYAGFILA